MSVDKTIGFPVRVGVGAGIYLELYCDERSVASDWTDSAELGLRQRGFPWAGFSQDFQKLFYNCDSW